MNNNKKIVNNKTQVVKKPVVKKVIRPTERIEVRKLYPGPAALFSLLHALAWAVIGFLAVLIYGFVSKGGIVLGTSRYATTGEIFMFSGIVFGIILVGLFVMVFLCTLIYNLVSKMKGLLHIGLAEYVAPPKKPKMPKVSKRTPQPVVTKHLKPKK